MIHLISRSITQGPAAGIVSLGGVALGFVFYMLCAAFGITALLFAVPYGYDALRLAGAPPLLFAGGGGPAPPPPAPPYANGREHTSSPPRRLSVFPRPRPRGARPPALFARGASRWFFFFTCCAGLWASLRCCSGCPVVMARGGWGAPPFCCGGGGGPPKAAARHSHR